MKKETVDSLLEGIIDDDNIIEVRNALVIATPKDIFVITQFVQDVEVHQLDDAIQINYPDSTVLIAYEAIQTITLN